MLHPGWGEVLDHADALIGMVELRPEGLTFALINRRSAQLFGSPPSLPPGLQHLWRKQCGRCIERGVPVRFEFAWPGAEGDQWFCVTLSSIADNRLCYVGQDVTQQKHGQARLKSDNEQLVLGMNQLKERARELALLGELGRALGDCLTLEQAHQVLTGALPLLFEGVSGSLGTVEGGTVEVVVRWGPLAPPADPFPVYQCRAIQTVAFQRRNAGGTGAPCDRCPSRGTSLCLPLVVEGKAVGMLSLSEQMPGHLNLAKQALAMATVEQVALALTHLQLRCILQVECVRDPLTGLFNRRYLEEFLDQHVNRQCQGNHVGLVVLDVDHFKSFNDRWGHEAGDAVLKEIALLLRCSVRQGDAACRFGGEEFVLVLPGADLEASRQRAEQIRMAIEHLKLRQRDGIIEPITVSVGVAEMNERHTSGSALFLAADEALFLAKKQGRNRVIVAL